MTGTEVGRHLGADPTITSQQRDQFSGNSHLGHLVSAILRDSNHNKTINQRKSFILLVQYGVQNLTTQKHGVIHSKMITPGPGPWPIYTGVTQ